MSDELQKIRKIKAKNERKWLAIDGVVAVGIGKTVGGRLGIIVHVTENAPKYQSRIVRKIEGIPVEVRESGEIKAL